MKFLHTSDWHLGQNLISKSRESEHAKFLEWLLDEIQEREIEVLIVAGDIFDTGTPPGYAQRMYFDFLSKLKNAGCRYCLITGGNHDSPANLNASAKLLANMGVTVLGKIPENIEDQVLTLKDEQGVAKLILCAIPFLRDRDVRLSVAGETYDEKGDRLRAGVAAHFAKIAEIASEKQKEFSDSGNHIPVIATGHLFMANCKTTESVREIYIGNLGGVSLSDFPQIFDYMALGHLHVPQLVGGNEHIRYSGSPISMSFDESSQQKIVIVGEFTDGLNLETVTVPRFQEMQIIKGNCDEVEDQLSLLVEQCDPDKSVWVEIQIEAEREIPEMAAKLNAIAEDSWVEIMAVKHIRKNHNSFLTDEDQSVQLEDLTPKEVFERKLEGEADLSDEKQEEMRLAFQEILEEVQRGDLA